MKNPLQIPFIKKILAPLVRGLVKQIPIIGTPIVEITSNLTQPDGEPKKHTNLSLIVQGIIAGTIILDIILNKGADLKALMDYFGVLDLLK
jgi:hypothetical protein